MEGTELGIKMFRVQFSALVGICMSNMKMLQEMCEKTDRFFENI